MIYAHINGISRMSSTVSWTYTYCVIRNTLENLMSLSHACTHPHTRIYVHIHSPFLYIPYSIRPDYIDISRQFYSDPEGWLQGKFPNTNTPLPSHLVLFDVLVPVSRSLCIRTFLFIINYCCCVVFL